MYKWPDSDLLFCANALEEREGERKEHSSVTSLECNFFFQIFRQLAGEWDRMSV